MSKPQAQSDTPFDQQLLQRLMNEADIDLLLATSKPNVQYLLGGFRFFFFEHADAIGQSRYLPIVIYPRSGADQAAYIGHRMEAQQQQVAPLWVPEARNVAGGSKDAMQQALRLVRERNLPTRRIAVELASLPADAFRVLQDAYPNADIIDALPLLERLRACKTQAEIEKLRFASDRVIAAMLAVISRHGPGTTKHDLVEARCAGRKPSAAWNSTTA
jgi:Xaa-Pro aminopeptidase